VRYFENYKSSVSDTRRACCFDSMFIEPMFISMLITVRFQCLLGYYRLVEQMGEKGFDLVEARSQTAQKL
jgi:hypothetical protein